MDFKIEFIVIGSEILNGFTKDTNIYALTKFLSTKGLSLSHVQIVPDKENALKDAFLLAHQRSSIIITSGGLGPTLDDLTKPTFAKTFSLQLEKSKDAALVAELNFKKFERTCDFTQNHYDLIPAGTVALQNPKGLAPAIFGSLNDKKYLLAPGVPKEFIAIVEEVFWPLLETKMKIPQIRNLVWKTTGIPEEKIFNKLCPELWSFLEQFGSVSSLPYHSGVDVRLQLNNTITEDQIEQIGQYLKSCALSPYIWTTDEIQIQNLIFNLLKKKNITLGFVESCTGGYASHLLTTLAGCSEFFVGSIIPYQIKTKHNLLGLNDSVTQQTGVNEESARELALKGKQLLKCDVVLSFTGFAGPSGGDKNNPLGRLWMAIATSSGDTIVDKVDLIGSRIDLIEKFTHRGMHFLRKYLQQSDLK